MEITKMVSKEEVLQEAHNWLKVQGIEGVEVVAYQQHGDGIMWNINISHGDKRFEQESEELRVHLNNWVREQLRLSECESAKNV